MQNIEEFVDKLIKDKGFNEQDPDVIAQIKSDLVTRAEDRINAMIVSKLDPEKLAEFQKVLETGSEEEMQKFVKSNIPDIEERVATELLTFKNMYLG